MNTRIGLPDKIAIQQLDTGCWNSSLESFLVHAQQTLTKLTKALSILQTRHQLDDYGVLRVLVDIIDAHVPNISSVHRTFPQAVHYQDWSENSRLLTIAAVLRNIGLHVIVTSRGQQLQLLLSVADEYDMLNSNRQSYRLHTGSHIKTVVWDGHSQIGSVASLKNDQGWQETIVSVLRPFSFRNRTLPKFLFTKSEHRKMSVYQHRESIRYQYYPNLSEYLVYFPSFQFGHHIELAWQEARHMQFSNSLRSLRKKISNEEELMTTLCRTMQDQIQYVGGPLHSLHRILGRGEGDCDQLSMMFATWMLEMGYSVRDIIGCHWEDTGDGVGHVLLGVRINIKDDDDLAAFTIPKYGKYYCIDPVYYVRGYQGDLQSRVGKIAPKYKGRCKSLSIHIQNKNWFV